jgi:DegV family protein with EDD domain
MLQIVTDSTASLPPELAQQYGIHVVPQIINLDGDSFREGVDLSISEFYRRLETARELPTTSQPMTSDFLELFSTLTAGGDSVLTIVISHQLSGSYLSAQNACNLLPDADIHVIDSRTVSASLGFIVLEAARMARAGVDLDSIRARVARMSDGFCLFFLVDTLDFLRRGGRIGGAAVLIGTALSLKPILTLRNGRVEPFERVRTKRKAVARLLELMEERLDPRGGKSYLGVIHGNVPEQGAALREQLLRKFHPHEELFVDLTPAIATHTGPGVLGVGCFQDPA